MRSGLIGITLSLVGVPFLLPVESQASTGRMMDGAYVCNVSRYEHEGRLALPDDNIDDTHQIQKAINDCQSASFDVPTPRVVEFPTGTFHLDSKHHQKTLIVNGSDNGDPLRVQGNGATLTRVLRSRKVGYWADSLNVRGYEAEPIDCEKWRDPSKVTCVRRVRPSKRLYPVPDALLNGAPYKGVSRPAQNVTLEDLNFRFVWAGSASKKNLSPDCRRGDARHCVNGVGVVFAENLTLRNVSVVDAPQAAFAFVSVSPSRSVTSLVCDGCHAIRAGSEGFRVHAWEVNTPLEVKFLNSSSQQMQGLCRGRDRNVKGRKVHLWYMPFGNWMFSTPQAPSPAELARQSLSIQTSHFDDSAEIITTQGTYNLSIDSSEILGGITLLALSAKERAVIGRALKKPITQDSSFVLQGNHIQCSYWNNQSLRVPRSALYMRDLLGGSVYLSQFVGGLPEDMSSCYRSVQFKAFGINAL